MQTLLSRFWRQEQGQDVAEYAMMLIIILLLAGVSVRLLGANVKQVFIKTLVSADGSLKPGNDTKANVVQDCEDAVRQQLDISKRADFPTTTPEVTVRRIDNNDFSVESFVETRSAEGAVVRIDYSCQASCTQRDGCSVVAQLRK